MRIKTRKRLLCSLRHRPQTGAPQDPKKTHQHNSRSTAARADIWNRQWIYHEKVRPRRRARGHQKRLQRKRKKKGRSGWPLQRWWRPAAVAALHYSVERRARNGKTSGRATRRQSCTCSLIFFSSAEALVSRVRHRSPGGFGISGSV